MTHDRAAAALGLLAFCLVAAAAAEAQPAAGRGVDMPIQDSRTLLATAADPARELPSRIAALDALAGAGDAKLAPELRQLWRRSRPTNLPKAVNWDPEAAERVVDLHIILALAKSGDLALLPQIALLVARSGDVLSGPHDEHRQAAMVLREIGRLEPIAEMIEVVAKAPSAAGNVVRTLQLLDLPAPPTGGPVRGFPELDRPVSFTIHRLGEELGAIVKLSNGRVALSPGTTAMVARADYDRGEVRRQDATLAAILTDELDMLGLAYAVGPASVTIGVFPEAAALWRQRWPDYSKKLIWDADTRSWKM